MQRHATNVPTITPACLFSCRINKQQIVPIRVPVVPPGQFQTFREPFVDKSHVAQGLSLGQTHLATSGGLLCKYDVPCIGDVHSCHRSRRSPEPPYKDTGCRVIAQNSRKTHSHADSVCTRQTIISPFFSPVWACVSVCYLSVQVVCAQVSRGEQRVRASESGRVCNLFISGGSFQSRHS